MRNILATAGALSIILTALSAWAGCITECTSEYESTVDDCHLVNGRDPKDADILQLCLENAKDTYASCKYECGSQGVEGITLNSMLFVCYSIKPTQTAVTFVPSISTTPCEGGWQGRIRDEC